MCLEECFCVPIATELHDSELLATPLVQVARAHEGDVHAHVAMHGRAVVADEDAVGGGGPGGVARRAVEAQLVLGLGAQLLEDEVLLGRGDGAAVVDGHAE